MHELGIDRGCDLEVHIVSVVDKLVIESSNGIRGQVEGVRLPYLGTVAFDLGFEEAIGDVQTLMET